MLKSVDVYEVRTEDQRKVNKWFSKDNVFQKAILETTDNYF